jgi:hypothetical protein
MAKAGRPKPERGAVGKTNGKAQPAPPLTVALDTPSARVLADQASVIQDLQFVMDCCKRLLAELGRPERERDAVVPQALWSAALVAYGRCFGGGRSSGLTVDDVQNLPLQGAVTKFHEWVIEERERFTAFPADPFAASKIGAALSQADPGKRRVEGIAIFSTSHVLIDATGVGQLGALASELAKQTAGKARKQEDTVLADAQKLDLASLYEAPPLLPPPPAEAEPSNPAG